MIYKPVSKFAFFSYPCFLVFMNLYFITSLPADILFDPTAVRWTLRNDAFSRSMRWDTVQGYIIEHWKMNLPASHNWARSDSLCDFNLIINGSHYEGISPREGFRYERHEMMEEAGVTTGVDIHFANAAGGFDVTLHYRLSSARSVRFSTPEDQPHAAVEFWNTVHASGSAPLTIGEWRSMSWPLNLPPYQTNLYFVRGHADAAENDAADGAVREFRIGQEPLAERRLYSTHRSSREYLPWMSLHSDRASEGLTAGLEWSASWEMLPYRQPNNTCQVLGGMDATEVVIQPGESADSPKAYALLFRGSESAGEWAHRRYIEETLAPPMPENFPWSQYNTWFAHETRIHEATLMRELDRAQSLGIEAFVIDAGWYEGNEVGFKYCDGLGTWRVNGAKFPRSLLYLSNQVHDRGMKFGLWVEPERVDERLTGRGDDPFLDSFFSQNKGQAITCQRPYARHICFGNLQARDWALRRISSLIRDNNIDWLKWDVCSWQACDRADHGHGPGEGGYRHVLGLYYILDALRREFPTLVIENCAGGGKRMDFGLYRRTHIAWLSDTSSPSSRVREHASGTAVVFGTRYCNNWVVESLQVEMSKQELQTMVRSRFLGIPGFSIPLAGLRKDTEALFSQELTIWTRNKALLSNGRADRLYPQNRLRNLSDGNLAPENPWEAYQYTSPDQSKAIVLIFRTGSETSARITPVNLTSRSQYNVEALDGTVLRSDTGERLMSEGLIREIPDGNSSDILLFIRQ